MTFVLPFRLSISGLSLSDFAKRFAFLLIFFVSTSAFSQSIIVPSPQISPSPLNPVQELGQGVVSFSFFETLNLPIPARSNGVANVSIRVTFTGITLRNADVNLIQGRLVDDGFFSASFNQVANVLEFTQLKDIPGFSSYPVTIPVQVTEDSDSADSDNGVLINWSAQGASIYDRGFSAVYTFTESSNSLVAVKDVNATRIGRSASGNLLINDIDLEGDSILITTTPVNGPANGSVVISSNGDYVYRPNPNFVGEDVFSYRVCDNARIQVCDTADVVVRVIDALDNDNDKPIAIDDVGNTIVNRPLTGDLLSNDTDLNEGDVISADRTPVTSPENGTLTINPDGTYRYVPNNGFVGEDAFSYRVCDNETPQACDTAQVQVNVLRNPEQNITFANQDVLVFELEDTARGNVLSNDFDPEGNAQTVSTTPLSGPANGTLNLMPNGQFVYVPNPGFIGNDRFVYNVCDDGTPQACDTTSVHISIVPPVNAVIAKDDINLTPIDSVVRGNVLTNDRDEEGDNMTVTTTPVSAPQNGRVVLNANGVYTYTPNAGFEGEDVFSYRVCDDGRPQACDTAEVFIKVFPLPERNTNDAPIAINDINQTRVNVPLTGNMLSNDSDPEGGVLRVSTTPLTTPENGNLTINPDGTYRYVPNPDFVGEDEFTYRVCDEGVPQACDTATVKIDVIVPLGNITVANDDALLTETSNVASGNVLANDFDPEGNVQTVSTTPIQRPSNGQVTINADGSYTYTSNDGFTGNDQFTYQVCDNGLPQACDTATVYVAVSENTNSTIAIDDINVTQEDSAVSGNVLVNDLDYENDIQNVENTVVSGPDNGQVVISENGSYTYTPNNGFVGRDTFVYRVCDDGTPRACDEGRVFIRVIGVPVNRVNEPPLAVNDVVKTEMNRPLSSNVLANDSDPDEGDVLTVDTTPVIAPLNGQLVLNTNGTYTYTPNNDFVGEDRFFYEVCDNTPRQTLCDTAEVVINVLRDNGNSTFAHDDVINIFEDSTARGNLLDNDSDPEGDNQTVSTAPVLAPANGTLVLNANGTYVYTPNNGFVGNDQFVYRVCDSGNPSSCDTASVYVTVFPNLPDYRMVVNVLNNAVIINDTGVIDATFDVAELLGQDSKPGEPVSFLTRPILGDDVEILFDTTATSVGTGSNQRTVNNRDWRLTILTTGGQISFYLFTYVGNGGVFRGDTRSLVGLQYRYDVNRINTDRTLLGIISTGSGGENNSTNNVDSDIIRFGR